MTLYCLIRSRELAVTQDSHERLDLHRSSERQLAGFHWFCLAIGVGEDVRLGGTGTVDSRFSSDIHQHHQGTRSGLRRDASSTSIVVDTKYRPRQSFDEPSHLRRTAAEQRIGRDDGDDRRANIHDLNSTSATDDDPCTCLCLVVVEAYRATQRYLPFSITTSRAVHIRRLLPAHANGATRDVLHRPVCSSQLKIAFEQTLL